MSTFNYNPKHWTSSGETGPDQPDNAAPQICDQKKYTDCKFICNDQIRWINNIDQRITRNFCPTNNFPAASFFDNGTSKMAFIEYLKRKAFPTRQGT